MSVKKIKSKNRRYSIMKKNKGLLKIGLTLFSLGLILIALPAYAEVTHFTPIPDYFFIWGFCRVIGFVSSGAGALFTTIAGILAVFGAAMGNYRTAAAVIFVGCGPFVLQASSAMFFDQRCEIVYVNDGAAAEADETAVTPDDDENLDLDPLLDDSEGMEVDTSDLAEELEGVEVDTSALAEELEGVEVDIRPQVTIEEVEQ